MPVIILLYGTNATGKSTLGRTIASLLPRCAFIEIDELRYKVVGGLVAYSAGKHPNTDPDEYRRQCWMGVENAVRLAEGFSEHGFSSVIEGLDDECRPGTGWIEMHLGRYQVLTVALLCRADILSQRWQERGWGSSLPDRVFEELRWYRDHRTLFDCTLDTTTDLPEQGAESVYKLCEKALHVA